MRRILVVEDEEMLRESYELIIRCDPYEVDTAKDGEEALRLCQQNSYDLILLDLMMPELDGIGFLERFESDATKVIILSNLSSGLELDRALQLGAVDNIVKASLSPKELLSRIRYEMTSAV